jgi:hypothetical protein
MIVVAWWAISETDKLRRQVAEQNALRAAAGQGADTAPTPQQMAAMEQNLKGRQSTLENRRAVRDALRRGMVAEGGGPSALMRLVASTIPPTVWLTELHASGNRIEVIGRATDPAAIQAWIAQLGESREFTTKPISTVKVEYGELSNANASPSSVPRTRAGNVYAFSVSATLAHPFAEEGKLP